MKKRVRNKILCGMVICSMLLGCFPNLVHAEEKGIAITDITSKTAYFDWSAWAADYDYLGYYVYILTEKEMGDADPNKVESYFDWHSCSQTQEAIDSLSPNTKYYVCVQGNYYDWSECVDLRNGRELKAAFAQFTTKASKAANVKLNKKAANLTVGKKTTIQLKGVDLSNQSFASSNKKVAKVSGKGVVTAIKKGSCKITVTDKTTNKKYTCKITVKNKQASKDFLRKTGLKMIPNGSATVQLAVGAGKNLYSKWKIML